MNEPVDFKNKQIIGMIENFYLLRRLFIQRTTVSCPLHFGQVAIMSLIEQNENCTQAVIAEKLNVSAASVATSTKRLQKSGFITKTVDEENLRCKRLALTESGKKAISEIHKMFDEYDELIFKKFSESEKNKFYEYLERVVAEMKRLEGINENSDCPIELSMMLYRIMENNKN